MSNTKYILFTLSIVFSFSCINNSKNKILQKQPGATNIDSIRKREYSRTVTLEEASRIMDSVTKSDTEEKKSIPENLEKLEGHFPSTLYKDMQYVVSVLKSKGIMPNEQILVADSYYQKDDSYLFGQGYDNPDAVGFIGWWKYYRKSKKIIDADTGDELK